MGNVSENEPFLIKDKNLDLNLNMNYLNDSITYRIVLKNSSNDDYVIDKNSLNINSEYIDYNFIFDDNSSIIQSNSIKNVLLKIEYRKEVSANIFKNDIYNDINSLKISLSKFTNPMTGNRFLLLFILVVLISVGCIFTNKKFINLVFIVGLLIIPISAYAYCKVYITINVKVEIQKIAEFDKGRELNKKMSSLADGSGNIYSFRRSTVLPDNIKNDVQNQLNDVEEITVSDDTLNEELENIKLNSWRMSNFSLNEKDNNKYYCYDNETTCLSEYDIISSLRDMFVYIIEKDDDIQYLVYIDDNNSLEILSEEDFKDVLRKKIMNDQKNNILKNVFSSDRSSYLIYGWYDVSNQYMYYYCENDKLYLNSDSSKFFYDMYYLGDVSGIEHVKTAKVVDVSNMFYNVGSYCEEFVLDLTDWNTSKIKDMSYMFYNAGYQVTRWEIGNLSDWNTSNVIYMQALFCYSATNAMTWNVGDLSKWDTSSVVDMSSMFYGAGYNAAEWSVGNLSKWDTSNVTNMSGMFASAGFNATEWSVGDLSKWDTSKVTDMSSMFYGVGFNDTKWNVGNLSKWNTSNVENMSFMFSYAGYKATEWSIGNISKWDTSKVTNMSYMFERSGYDSTKWSVGDLSEWDTSKVTDMSYMFCMVGYNAKEVKFNVSGWDTSNVTTMYYTFYSLAYNAEKVDISMSGWTVNFYNNVTQIFMDLGKNAQEINIDMSDWTFSELTDISGSVFHIGENAVKINMNISNCNLPKVVNMRQVFSGFGSNATSLNLDVSNWNVPSATNMKAAFRRVGYSATDFKLNVSDWNTSSAEDMSEFFSNVGYNATVWSVGDLSKWDTSKVTDMSGMFSSAGHNASNFENIGTLNVSADNISNMFNSANVKVILNLYKAPIEFNRAFYNAATAPESSIVINYSRNVDNIDSIYNFNNTSNNIFKGELLD